MKIKKFISIKKCLCYDVFTTAKTKCAQVVTILRFEANLCVCHTVAIWTFPFHQNSVKKSDDFVDLTLAQ